MDRKPRRKSASPAASLKSPALAIKRSDTAAVTLKGWLYKQGSEGLQLWRKRWFVLSEYCLFYYKGNVGSLAGISVQTDNMDYFRHDRGEGPRLHPPAFLHDQPGI